MSNLEGSGEEPLRPYAGSPSPVKTENKRRRNGLLMVAVGVLVVVIAYVGLYELGYFSPQPSGGTQTWSQWGMSISYPAGLNPQLKGMYEQQATNNSGQVLWLWNKANTVLALTWANTTHADLEAGIQALHDALSLQYTNVTLVAQGNVTISGTSWPYVTYSYNVTGKIYYQTATINFYTSESRFYEIDFIDTNSNTLSSLMTYASTFTG